MLRIHSHSFAHSISQSHSCILTCIRVCSLTFALALLADCSSEQDGAATLGYTQASWDNLSGKEQQPWSSIKSWAALGATEKAAAALLGYTEANWDNELGTQPRPASAFKSWSDLAACGEGEEPSLMTQHPPPPAHPGCLPYRCCWDSLHLCLCVCVCVCVCVRVCGH